MLKNSGKYNDIINLSHHISKKHPRMSLEARSAQFAPFAALTGYDDVIKETARLTSERIDIDEGVKSILNRKLHLIREQIYIKPEITVTYFVPDSKKDGGSYVMITGNVIKIDDYKQKIVLENKIEIPMSEIIKITGKIFKEDEQE